jgi:hypothetical protein
VTVGKRNIRKKLAALAREAGFVKVGLIVGPCGGCFTVQVFRSEEQAREEAFAQLTEEHRGSVLHFELPQRAAVLRLEPRFEGAGRTFRAALADVRAKLPCPDELPPPRRRDARSARTAAGTIPRESEV